MANQPWVDEVRTQLEKHALPHVYIQRFIEELNDHITDIKEDTMSTEVETFARLGNPAEVSQKAVLEYRHRSFLGRHASAAFLFFAISPMVLLISLITIIFILLVALFWFIGEENLRHTSAFLRQFEPITSMALPYLLSILTIIIPSILSSILFCKLVKRLGFGKIWMLVSCATTAILASTLFWTVKLSDLPGQNNLMLGLKLYYPENIEQFTQIFVPLAICWWFMRRMYDGDQMKMAL